MFIRLGQIVVIVIFFISSQFSDAKTVEELRTFLKQDCGSCHGMHLKGGLGLPLTTDRMRPLSDAYLFSVIKDGKKDTAMPGWKTILSDDEIKTLIRFLKEGI